MMAAAMSTLYSLTPVEVLTRLFSATVIGWRSPEENTTPNRKSFQIWVNCQITHTTMMGGDSGRMMRQKMREEAGAVDAGRLDHLVGNVDVEIAEEQRGEGQPIHHMHENQPGGGIGDAQTAQRLRHRQQHHLERDEAAQQQQGEQQFAAAKAPHA